MELRLDRLGVSGDSLRSGGKKRLPLKVVNTHGGRLSLEERARLMSPFEDKTLVWNV